MNNRFSTAAGFLSCGELEDEVVEVSLLLPAWQAALLQSLADSRRVTVGQLLRGLITEYLAKQAAMSKITSYELLAR